jgi:GNAT superfamily N-acetyltransferase
VPEGPEIRIRPAGAADVPVLLDLIRGLAEYERLAGECVATAEGLRASLFEEPRGAEALLAFAGERPVGFALFFHNYSTFLGRRGLYLEDLFVLPEWRGRGVGGRLFAEVARLAVARRCGRLEWAVLDWNEPALGFYRKLGAMALDGWTVHRLTGAALARLAGQE